MYLEHDWIDNVTKGFWAADQATPIANDELEKWPVEQRAAYLARKALAVAEPYHDERTLALIAKMQAIWRKWQQMKGNNRPLIRSIAGPRRDFDINLDGMAHYGMLPDFLQDLRNVGLTAEDFVPLFRSAYDYVQMWDKCERRAVELARTPAL